MKRDIFSDLLKWRDDPYRKPLILKGARQVGKTWILKHFGETCFQNVAYVNFDSEPLAKNLFEEDYDIDRILLMLQSITGVKIEAGKTLIILDEVQEVKRGLHSLKYFCEDAPQYHVVAAGSLLGITLAKGESFPVGKVNFLEMHPLSFNEFLLAVGEEALSQTLLSADHSLISLFHTKYLNLLRQYYYVGGMPEVVADYAQRRDLSSVRQKQAEILAAYRRDISKHTSETESVLIGQVLNSIPSQLAKENKKFIYSVIKKGARAAKYELAIQWLIDAGIVQKVSRVNAIRMPLKFYEDLSAFKLFLLDCGLFGCMVDAPAGQMIATNSIFTEFKGAFTEQFVHQQFTAQGKKLYYWSSETSPAEIDFVLQTDDGVTPIEVKATENVRAKSMREYIRNHPEDHLKGLRFSMHGYKEQDWMINLPLYAIATFNPTTHNAHYG